MDSEGLFAKDAPFRNQRGGRAVNFGEHDNRAGGGAARRGGGRRGGRGRGYYNRGRGGQGRGVHPLSRLEDADEEGDIFMEDNAGRNSRRRYQPYKSPPNGGGGRGSVFSRLGASSGGSSGSVFSRLSGLGGERPGGRGASWHKITIPKGATQNQDWVLKQLQSIIKEPFQPVQIHTRGDKLMFFVEEFRAANQLKRMKQLDTRDGPLPVYVKPCPPPKGSGGDDGDQRQQRFSRPPPRGGGGRGRGRDGSRFDGGARFDGDIQMEEDTTAVVLQVLGQRFDTSTRSLDLSDMFHDQTLKQHGVKGTMYDRNFVSTVLSLIGQHCSDLLALDLSNNRLQHLDAYAELPSKCANLQILNLSDNQLRSAAELEHIKNMNSLTTLVLENNPFAQHNHDSVSYSSNMRRLFPSLQLLDGQQLPSPVRFDLPVSAGQLPSIEKSYLVNDEVKSLVVTFLEQYYTMYDGDSREKLLEAYSNDAVFSLSISMPPAGSRGPPLQSYIHQSRNLSRVRDPNKRHSLLKHGRIDVVQFLRDLPKTRHHPGAFNVDVIRATPVSTAFVVYGLFSEVSGPRLENSPVRAFSRTFVLAAAGNGVAIINDQLTIRNPNPKSVQYAKEEVGKLLAQQQPTLEPPMLPQTSVQQPSVPSGASSSLPGPSFQTPPQSFGNTQEDVVRRLSSETEMNQEWSRKCLAENDWDYNKAVMAFNLLQSQGRVPAEAFT